MMVYYLCDTTDKLGILTNAESSFGIETLFVFQHLRSNKPNYIVLTCEICFDHSNSRMLVHTSDQTADAVECLLLLLNALPVQWTHV
jgi:hypothetical protein